MFWTHREHRKVSLHVQEFLFLGHVISKSGVCPDPRKTAPITDFPPPTTRRKYHSSLGLRTCSRHFVKRLSQIAEPLTHLTKSGIVFRWEAAQKDAFQQMKRRLQTTPILAHFYEFVTRDVPTDESSLSLLAILAKHSRP